MFQTSWIRSFLFEKKTPKFLQDESNGFLFILWWSGFRNFWLWFTICCILSISYNFPYPAHESLKMIVSRIICRCTTWRNDSRFRLRRNWISFSLTHLQFFVFKMQKIIFSFLKWLIWYFLLEIRHSSISTILFAS